METKGSRDLDITEQYKSLKAGDGEVRVSQLTTSENLIVFSIRAWVDALKSKRNPMLDIQKGFVCAGIQDTSIAFDELMLVTATSAHQSLDVRYLCCQVLGDAELDFIAVISFAQQGKSEWAFRRLCSWLPPAAARRSARRRSTRSIRRRRKRKIPTKRARNTSTAQSLRGRMRKTAPSTSPSRHR